MENPTEPTFAPETLKYLEHFLVPKNSDTTTKKGENDKALGSALLYEKIRVALEYQEEHLVFKNAVSRILRRKYTLNPGIAADHLLTDLLNELSWANYLNPDTLSKEEQNQLTKICERYLVLLDHVRSAHIPKLELQKMVISWWASEIDEVVKPNDVIEPTIEYTYSILKLHLKADAARISLEDQEIQLKLAIFTLIFKPDPALLQYWSILRLYPNWKKWDKEELAKFGRSFDPYYNKVFRVLNHPFRTRYLQYTKRNIAPFILMTKLLRRSNVSLDHLKEKPMILKEMVLDEYDAELNEVRAKVWRGTIRALIFILITKISLALIIELPIDRYFGEINYLSLAINICLPPLLMLVAGTFVKSPPKENRRMIADVTASIIAKGKLTDRIFSLERKKQNSELDNFFNIFYSLVSLGILVGAVWLLIKLGFNVVSIGLFFFFVSAVSFFSFRIRSIALELAMKRSRDDALTSTLEFIFLPFIRIGKFISERIAQTNPFILALDFLIEAPLKTIIKIGNLWLKFVNSKKEEIEF